jgi:Na+/melibiose symporter-like transporter
MRRFDSHPLFQGELGKSRLLLIFDGIFANAAAVLTAGVFLSGFIVFLDGSDLLTGLINSSANWAAIAMLFSFLLFERLKKRKWLLILVNLASRLLLCGAVFLPLFSENKAAILPIVVVMVILSSLLSAFYGTGFTVWLFGVLPKERQNDFIYLRMFWLRVAYTTVTILAGFALDLFQKGYAGFLLLFSFSLGLSILDIILLSKIKEPAYEVDRNAKPGFGLLLEPLRNDRFRSYLAFVFLFFAMLGMSSTFTPVYLIRYMKFDYTFISTMNVIQYACMIGFTAFWRKMEVRNGVAHVFRMTATVAVFEFLLYGFLTTKTAWILVPATMLAGIGNSGLFIALLNYRYGIIPDKNRTVYESWFAAVYGLSALASPIVGNFIMQRLPVVTNRVFEHSKFQFMYLLSFILVQLVLFLSFRVPDKRRLIQ